MSNNLDDLLRSGDNLEIALSIEEQLSKFRRSIFVDYWNRVREDLVRRLSENCLNTKWRVSAPHYDKDITRHSNLDFLAIVQRDGPNYKDGSKNAYCVYIEYLAGPGDKAFYGIRREYDLKGSTPSPVEDALIKALTSQGFEQKWWCCGLQRARHINRGDSIDIQNSKCLIDFFKDNRDNGPRAGEISDALYTLFVQYREVLEDMNARWPYR